MCAIKIDCRHHSNSHRFIWTFFSNLNKVSKPLRSLSPLTSCSTDTVGFPVIVGVSNSAECMPLRTIYFWILNRCIFIDRRMNAVFNSILKKANDLNWWFEKKMNTGFHVLLSVTESDVIFMLPQQFFLTGKILREKKGFFPLNLHPKFKILSKWKCRNQLFPPGLQTLDPMKCCWFGFSLIETIGRLEQQQRKSGHGF